VTGSSEKFCLTSKVSPQEPHLYSYRGIPQTTLHFIRYLFGSGFFGHGCRVIL